MSAMTYPILSMALHGDADVVAARQRARRIAELIGFDPQEQTRIATAASEIARNALRYAGGGRVEFGVDGPQRPQLLTIAVLDRGPGIPDVETILQGQYVSTTGLGLGIIGSRRLLDQFRIESAPGRGTSVRMGKVLPARAKQFRAEDARRVAEALAGAAPASPVDELQQQNQELIVALDELRRRQEELSRLNAELEDTNRGVVALYAELDEKADSLRRADEMKSRFLSNMSHEFRTPLNSMRALSQLLLDRTDGPLTAEQEIQVSLIQRSAEDLSELVNDLLDLARVEAGKTMVRPSECDVRKLFGALRGMLRPLLVSDAVALVFDDPDGLPTIFTDESKVSQILRNFISNALKFTERGEVRVCARRDPADDTIVFAVSDTGIGIPPEHHERIFHEFGQVDHPLQRNVRGTGLGLPLSRKLAHLLGGDITLVSAPGKGATFSLRLPLVYREAPDAVTASPPAHRSASPLRTRRRVLVVDDDEAARYLVRRWLTEADYEVIEEAGGLAAADAARVHAPDAIVLDLMMPDATGFEVLQLLAEDPATRDIPVIVHTAMADPPARERLGERVVDVVVKNQTAASAAALRAAVARATNAVRM